MVDENKIPSREEVHNRLKKLLESTLQYIESFEEHGKETELQLIPDMSNWDVHEVVAKYPQVAAYFPQDLAKRSASLWQEWAGLYAFCGRRAYYDNLHVQSRNFPWFEEMDLYKNLKKKLTIGQMAEFGANGTYLYDWEQNTIANDAMTEIIRRVKSSRLYDRKKNLEERMINHLEI